MPTLPAMHIPTLPAPSNVARALGAQPGGLPQVPEGGGWRGRPGWARRLVWLLSRQMQLSLIGLVFGSGCSGTWAGPTAASPAPELASSARAAPASAGAPTEPVVSGPAASGPAAAAAASSPQRLMRVPRAEGRLQASQVGLVINLNDPYSVAVGAYYQARRGLKPSQVLRVRLPLQPQLDPSALQALRAQAGRSFGPQIQAVALAWRQPYAVECQSVTAAFSLGRQAGLCDNTCAKGRDSAYFNSASARPWPKHGLRPSMLLAAPDEAQARAMIDRGVAADGQLGRVFSPAAQAVFVQTADAARNVRAVLYPPPAHRSDGSLRLLQTDVAGLARLGEAPALLLQIGAAQLPPLGSLRFLPGALADHLTSFGGVLDGSQRQALATDWIAAGATASHGTVSEPCNHLQKFPHPQLLLWHYLQGETAIEAYWKSVRWPDQSLFVGEPLAAPFAPLLSPAGPAAGPRP